MNYTYEQIMSYDQYQKICQYFFCLAKDQETKKILEDILYTGSIGNYTVHSEMQCRDNLSIERQRRISMAYLLVSNPETFTYLVQHNICLFHGTNANALPSIIKYGVNSNSSLQEKGLEIYTGEYSFFAKRRSFISFTDVLDLARGYATLPCKNGSEQLSFGVVLGTDSSAMKNVRTCAVRSDLSEIGVVDSFPLEDIRCILVPRDKVKLVTKMLKKPDITVLGISDEEEKFYYIDNSMGTIEIYQDIYEKFKKGITKTYHKFSILELEEVVKSCSAKKMWQFLNSMKIRVNNGLQMKSEVEDGRKR